MAFDTGRGWPLERMLLGHVTRRIGPQGGSQLGPFVARNLGSFVGNGFGCARPPGPRRTVRLGGGLTARGRRGRLARDGSRRIARRFRDRRRLWSRGQRARYRTGLGLSGRCAGRLRGRDGQGWQLDLRRTPLRRRAQRGVFYRGLLAPHDRQNQHHDESTNKHEQQLGLQMQAGQSPCHTLARPPPDGPGALTDQRAEPRPATCGFAWRVARTGNRLRRVRQVGYAQQHAQGSRSGDGALRFSRRFAVASNRHDRLGVWSWLAHGEMGFPGEPDVADRSLEWLQRATRVAHSAVPHAEGRVALSGIGSGCNELKSFGSFPDWEV